MKEKKYFSKELDTMHTTLKKQGNSSAVIIRSEWKKALNIDNGSHLEVTIDHENQRLILTPKKLIREKYSLAELVAEAKTQYSPAEIKIGRVGDEQF